MCWGPLALASPVAFHLADDVYGALYRSQAGQTALLTVGRVGLIVLVMLPPTVLMGGTLPLFCRQFVVKASGIGSTVGFLYAVNTLGAAAGCAATGLVLLPAVGVRGSIAIGATLSAAAGIVVALLRLPVRPPRRPEPVPLAAALRRRKVFVALLFFVTGFVALGSEVMWTRYLALIIRNTVYTYTLSLTTVLIGIVLGSLLAGRFADRAGWPRAATFGTLQVLTGLSVIECTAIVVLTCGREFHPLPMVVGTVLASAIYCLTGFIAVARYDSINEFLFPSMLWITALSLPIVHYAGLWESPLIYLHPLQASLVLLKGTVFPLAPWEWLYGVLYSGLWIVFLHAWGRRTFQRFVVATAGAH